MSIKANKKMTTLHGIDLSSENSLSDAVIQMDSVASVPTTTSGLHWLYVDSLGRLVFDNGVAPTVLGAPGASPNTWEALYALDNTFNISSNTWTITQSSANALMTHNKTNVGG